MKSRKIFVITIFWTIALLVFVWAYLADKNLPAPISHPPVVIIPKQPDIPAHVVTTAEKELEERQAEQLKASIANAVKNGKIPTPYPPVTGRDQFGEPLKTN